MDTFHVIGVIVVILSIVFLAWKTSGRYDYSEVKEQQNINRKIIFEILFIFKDIKEFQSETFNNFKVINENEYAKNLNFYRSEKQLDLIDERIKNLQKLIVQATK